MPSYGRAFSFGDFYKDDNLCVYSIGMELTDDELVENYRTGDEAAFKALIERYVDPIYVFARRMTGTNADAEDVSQETFVKVWRMIDRYKLTGTFKAWISAIDRLRKKKVPVFSDFETAEGMNSLVDTLSDPETLPSTLIKKAEDKNLVESGLAALSVEDREILTLHYTEELTFEAIGKMLKKPLNTVKSKHRRALAKLKGYLEEWNE